MNPQYDTQAGPRRWQFGKNLSTWPVLKVARALQHKVDLEARLQLWAASGGFSVDEKIAEDGQGIDFFLHVHHQPPLLEWSLILGEFLYNLRSALDACVWELAHVDGAVPPKPTQLQFPIESDQAGWEATRKRRLQTVPDEAADRIALVQPFNRPAAEVEADGLLLLNELNNLDKHRSSIALKLDPNGVNFNHSIKFASKEATERNVPPSVDITFPDTLADRSRIARMTFCDPVESVQGGIVVSIQSFIETSRGPLDLGAVMQGLLGYVQQVLQMVLSGPVTEEDLKKAQEAAEAAAVPLEILGEGRNFYSGPLAEGRLSE